METMTLAIRDFWFGFWTAAGRAFMQGLGATASVDGSQKNTVFEDKVERQMNRDNALGVALRVILSSPGEETVVITLYRLAATTIRGVDVEHLPVLLWYRDLVAGKKPYTDLRRYLVNEMSSMIERDIWPIQVSDTTDVMVLVEQWRTLVAAKKSR